MFKLNKNQLDLLGSVFGATAGICTVLATQQVGDARPWHYRRNFHSAAGHCSSKAC